MRSSGRAGPGEDTGEPSWAVLGSLIRETRFVHVQHRLYFMRHWWHVPVEEFWNEARPLVARHRFQPYLLTMAIGTPEAERAFAESFDPSWLPDLEYAEEPMLKKLGKIAEAKRTTAWSLVQLHMDHLVRDFATQSDIYWIPNRAESFITSTKRAFDSQCEQDPHAEPGEPLCDVAF